MAVFLHSPQREKSVSDTCTQLLTQTLKDAPTGVTEMPSETGSTLSDYTFGKPQ